MRGGRALRSGEDDGERPPAGAGARRPVVTLGGLRGVRADASRGDGLDHPCDLAVEVAVTERVRLLRALQRHPAGDAATDADVGAGTEGEAPLRRTLADLYPDFFRRRETNKQDEAVANPVRDGSAKGAEKEYEERMQEIYAECRRVLKPDGVMTIMFTHKKAEAWDTLTRALIT